MTQGMFAAVSGIRVNQARLNIVSNNVANLNTIAFKSSNINFQNVMGQTLFSGTTPGSTTGGTNPMQLGVGAKVADIQQNFNQGSSLFTGRQNDLLVEGNGFFTVRRPSASVTSTATADMYLTRAGNFTRDAEGNLVSSAGEFVMGTSLVQGDAATNISPIKIYDRLTIYKERNAAGAVVGMFLDTSPAAGTAPTAGAGNTMETNSVNLVNYSIGVDGGITTTYSNGDRITVQTNPNTGQGNNRELMAFAAEGQRFAASFAGTPTNANGPLTAITGSGIVPSQLQLRMAMVTNPEGLIQEGNNNYTVGANSGTLSLGIGGTGGRGKVQGGALESSNVDVAQEFTNMIIAQRGVEASGKLIGAHSEVLRTIINII